VSANKIILIDDDRFVHTLFQKILMRHAIGKQVMYTVNGKEVIDFLQIYSDNSDTLPEYIFVDICMPFFTGWDFLNGMVPLYELLGKKIAIYVISTSVKPEDIGKARSYPFVTDYIVKPTLKVKLEQVLKLNNL
jgi:two-component SAPR family response regulator